MSPVARAGFSVVSTLPVWTVPALVFGAALLVALRAAAWFTRQLEELGDRWNFSPGLLSFVSALGANIPNYAASSVAFAGGHASIGLGIIVGSNIYNLAIILGLVTFATPGGRGIALAPEEIGDARLVGWLVTAMGVTTWVSVYLFTSPLSWPASSLPRTVTLVTALTIGLFLGLAVHALRRVAPTEAARLAAGSQPSAGPASTRRRAPPAGSAIVGCVFALALALAGVIVMVQAGQVVGAEVRLSTTILSLVVLAVATSLPNTVVAYQLARAARAEACVEEILSSNGINLALGCTLPVLVWGGQFANASLLHIDLPMLGLLGLVVVALMYTRGIPRPVGIGLLSLYAVWVLWHVLM